MWCGNVSYPLFTFTEIKKTLTVMDQPWIESRLVLLRGKTIEDQFKFAILLESLKIVREEINEERLQWRNAYLRCLGA